MYSKPVINNYRWKLIYKSSQKQNYIIYFMFFVSTLPFTAHRHWKLRYFYYDNFIVIVNNCKENQFTIFCIIIYYYYSTNVQLHTIYLIFIKFLGSILPDLAETDGQLGKHGSFLNIDREGTRRCPGNS